MSQPQSLAAVFIDRVAEQADLEAFRAPGESGWNSMTWQETDARARELAGGLLSLGLETEDRVAIAATTRLEWILADLAVMMAGGATTSVYPTTQTSDVAFILSDAECVVAVVEDGGQLGKLLDIRDQLPRLRTVVVIDTDDLGEPGADGTWQDGWVISLDQLAERGRAYLAEHPTAIDDILATLTPGHLATLIYTSGTTGRPKGVELTHQNWIYLGEAVEKSGIVNADDVHFLWLPLSHVFGKLLLAAQYWMGFATAVDGRVDRIVENLGEIRPTFMAAAPRIFEKVHARVTSTAHEEGGAKAMIFDWAIGVGLACVRKEQAGQSVPPHLVIQRVVADRLVFSKIRDRLGGRLEKLVSGSAALAPEIAEWFAAAGLPILEGYGMTECTGASAVNRPGGVRIGSVGQPLAGAEIRIAEDGEILFRSAGVMRGYRNLPEETASVLSADGWLATGDVGEIGPDGTLKITDRKKDLAKTSGGKYIAPSHIEGSLKAADPLIGQAVVIAEGRKFPSALIAIDTDTATAWGEHHGVALHEVHSDPRIQKQVEAAVASVNQALNRWEQVKQFRILPRELDVESGELTPSLKVKRPVVTKNYADLIEEMYR